jgi:hypothetical protein
MRRLFRPHELGITLRVTTFILLRHPETNPAFLFHISAHHSHHRTPDFKMIAILTLLLFFLGRTQSQQCYYPAANPAPNDIPCSSSIGFTFCCAPGWACLDYGICMSTALAKGWNGTTEYLRGSCTDQKWGEECPPFCLLGLSLFLAMTSCTSS